MEQPAPAAAAAMDDPADAWQREWARSTESEEQEPSSRGGDDAGGDDAGGEGHRRRRFSIGLLGRKIASVANDVGASIARTAAAAGELISDSELRSRSAALLAERCAPRAAGCGGAVQERWRAALPCLPSPRLASAVPRCLPHAALLAFL